MDDDDERILELEFADDNLESLGYERPIAGPLVLYDRDQHRDDGGTSAGALFRPESPYQVMRPAPGLGRLDPAPQHETNPARESEPKAPLNSSNVNINISVNGEDAHIRRRAVLPTPVGAGAGGAEASGNSGTKDARPRHARPNMANPLLYIALACLVFLAASCLITLLRAGGHGQHQDTGQLSPVPRAPEEAIHVAPGAFSKAHENLKQDLAQLEELFYRARSALPPASTLRHVLEDGPQPQELREVMDALGSLHGRLVGNVLESDVARDLRVSKGRLRAATTKPDGGQGLWGSSQSLGTVRAEWAHAKDMSASVTNMIDDIDAVRARAAHVCRYQPLVNSYGSWTLSEDSTCPNEENQWELKGGFTMSLGNGVSDAQAAFGFINWICHDLDALTAADSTSQASVSITAEARRMLERWDQLLHGWSDLEAAIAAK